MFANQPLEIKSDFAFGWDGQLLVEPDRNGIGKFAFHNFDFAVVQAKGRAVRYNGGGHLLLAIGRRQGSPAWFGTGIEEIRSRLVLRRSLVVLEQAIHKPGRQTKDWVRILREDNAGNGMWHARVAQRKFQFNNRMVASFLNRQTDQNFAKTIERSEHGAAGGSGKNRVFDDVFLGFDRALQRELIFRRSQRNLVSFDL